MDHFTVDDDYVLFMSLRRNLSYRRLMVVTEWYQLFVSTGASSVSLDLLCEIFDNIVNLLCARLFDEGLAHVIGGKLCYLCGVQPHLFSKAQQVLLQKLIVDLPGKSMTLIYSHLTSFSVICATEFATRFSEISALQQTAFEQLYIVERCLHAVVEHLPLFVFTLDTNQKFRYVKGKGLNILNLDSSTMIGQFITDVIPNPDVSYCVCRALRGEHIVAMVELHTTVLEMRCEPLRDSHGSIRGMLGVAYDATYSAHVTRQLSRSKNESSSHTVRFCHFDESWEEYFSCVSHGELNDGNRWCDEPHTLMKERISDREIEILECVALGMTNKQIAKALILSPKTVKWYLEQIYRKLQVANRTSAVRRARNLKLLR